MQNVNLEQTPNQTFTTSIDGVEYAFTLRTFKDVLYASVDIDGERVVSSYRCVNSGLVLPFAFLKRAGKGNFAFIDSNGEYPDWRNFGNSCKLVYFTEEDMVRMTVRRDRRNEEL